MLHKRITKNSFSLWGDPLLGTNRCNKCFLFFQKKNLTEEKTKQKLKREIANNENVKRTQEEKEEEKEQKEKKEQNRIKEINNILLKNPTVANSNNSLNIKIEKEKIPQEENNYTVANILYKKIVKENKLDAKRKTTKQTEHVLKESNEKKNIFSGDGENNTYKKHNKKKEKIIGDTTILSKNHGAEITKLHQNNQLMTTVEKSEVNKTLDKKDIGKIKQNEIQIKKETNNDIVYCTAEKNINTLLKNTQNNKLILNEKKKIDHFYKIFFSSKKVKIIKSQNHPVFIHLYKLATDINYREKQEKILLTNKKLIIERQKNHINRIYTNSINNLKDFQLFDNFILLSNRLLKKISVLYSFKNGVVAEMTHKFNFDSVGFPRLSFCFYNINYNKRDRNKNEGNTTESINARYKEKETNAFQKIYKKYNDDVNVNANVNINADTNVERERMENKEQTEPENYCVNKKYETKVNDQPYHPGKQIMRDNGNESMEYLSNGDIGTLIRSCFLLKWQCIYYINDLKRNKKTKKENFKNRYINSIYDIDLFHPLTIRASSGHILDIPYKYIDFEELHTYAKNNKILLLKYNCNSDFSLSYKKKSTCEEKGTAYSAGNSEKLRNSEKSKIVANSKIVENSINVTNSENVIEELILQSKGVCLIVDNCNNIEKKFPNRNKNYVRISNDKNSTDIYDYIYYVNLKNMETKNLGIIASYSIFMHLLKFRFFGYVPQSPYIYID